MPAGSPSNHARMRRTALPAALALLAVACHPSERTARIGPLGLTTWRGPIGAVDSMAAIGSVIAALASSDDHHPGDVLLRSDDGAATWHTTRSPLPPLVEAPKTPPDDWLLVPHGVHLMA